MEWSDIQDDVIRLKPQIAKNKDGRVIIIIGEIANIIARRQADRVDSCPYVFHREGHRIKVYLTGDLLIAAYENHRIPGDL